MMIHTDFFLYVYILELYGFRLIKMVKMILYLLLKMPDLPNPIVLIRFSQVVTYFG